MTVRVWHLIHCNIPRNILALESNELPNSEEISVCKYAKCQNISQRHDHCSWRPEAWGWGLRKCKSAKRKGNIKGQGTRGRYYCPRKNIFFMNWINFLIVMALASVLIFIPKLEGNIWNQIDFHMKKSCLKHSKLVKSMVCIVSCQS